MTKDNFYIITGGPGGGKTTLLEMLFSKGYSFIPETARQIIKDRLSAGLSPRPDPLTFATDIFKKDLSNFERNINCPSLLFFDRSFVDSSFQIFSCDQERYEQIKIFSQTNRYNNTVFITPPWEEIYTTDTERDQAFEHSIEIYGQLYQWYRQHNYDLIVLPKDSVDNRVKFVLDQIPK